MVDSVIVLNVDISLDTESDMDTLSLILLNVFINLLTESDTETDSDNDLTAPSILDTESLTDMVVSVIDLKLDSILDIESDTDVESDTLLKAAINLLTESETDTDSVMLLNEPSILDTLSLIDTDTSVIDLNDDSILDMESDTDTLSVSVLNAPNSLETLSVIMIDTPVIVLNVSICLVTESVIAYVPAAISNGGVLKTRLSNFPPRSKICLIDDGLTIVIMPSPTATADSVIILNVESNLLIESLTVIVLSVIVLKIA